LLDEISFVKKKPKTRNDWSLASQVSLGEQPYETAFFFF